MLQSRRWILLAVVVMLAMVAVPVLSSAASSSSDVVAADSSDVSLDDSVSSAALVEQSSAMERRRRGGGNKANRSPSRSNKQQQQQRKPDERKSTQQQQSQQQKGQAQNKNNNKNDNKNKQSGKKRAGKLGQKGKKNAENKNGDSDSKSNKLKRTLSRAAVKAAWSTAFAQGKAIDAQRELTLAAKIKQRLKEGLGGKAKAKGEGKLKNKAKAKGKDKDKEKGKESKKAQSAAQQKDALEAALDRVALKAYKKAKRMQLNDEQTKAFVKQERDKARIRLTPKKADKVTDPELRRLLGGVKKTRSRKAIGKLQSALKKKRAGAVEVPIGHHKITVRPRTPRKKKLKIHKPSPTDRNYVKHLEASKAKYNRKIKSLKAQIHAAGQRPQQDWPIEYSTLDPPDDSQAALAKELINDFKPFLKAAVSIKEGDLSEAKQNLVEMERLRNEVRDKLDKAKATPLLPDIYRFIE